MSVGLEDGTWVDGEVGGAQPSCEKLSSGGSPGSRFSYPESVENVLLRASQARRCYTVTQSGILALKILSGLGQFRTFQTAKVLESDSLR